MSVLTRDPKKYLETGDRPNDFSMRQHAKAKRFIAAVDRWNADLGFAGSERYPSGCQHPREGGYRVADNLRIDDNLRS